LTLPLRLLLLLLISSLRLPRLFFAELRIILPGVGHSVPFRRLYIGFRCAIPLGHRAHLLAIGARG